MSTTPMQPAPLMIGSLYWNHLKHAHGYDGAYMAGRTAEWAGDEHRKEHRLAPGDPGPIGTEPVVREPTSLWEVISRLRKRKKEETAQ